MRYVKNGHLYDVDFNITKFDYIMKKMENGYTPMRHDAIWMTNLLQTHGLEVFEAFVYKINTVSTSSSRCCFFNRAAFVYHLVQDAQNLYEYNPTSSLIVDRFIQKDSKLKTLLEKRAAQEEENKKIKLATEQANNRGKMDWKDITSNVIKNEEFGKELPTYEDGIECSMPEAQGVYLIGSTRYDPKQDKVLYLLKIGKSVNLANRQRSYDTNQPMTFYIDYLLFNEDDPNKGKCNLAWLECIMQNALRTKAIAKDRKSKEWFLFDKETYLEICDKGFAYFKK